jgi:hypothetical protein
MKQFIRVAVSIFLIGILFSACAFKSIETKKISCTKENINNCKQEDKLLAVKDKPELIRYIKKPNQEIQLEAVGQDAKLIRFIKKPNQEVQITALKQDPSVVEFIKKPSKEAMRY